MVSQEGKAVDKMTLPLPSYLVLKLLELPVRSDNCINLPCPLPWEFDTNPFDLKMLEYWADGLISFDGKAFFLNPTQKEILETIRPKPKRPKTKYATDKERLEARRRQKRDWWKTHRAK